MDDAKAVLARFESLAPIASAAQNDSSGSESILSKLRSARLPYLELVKALCDTQVLLLQTLCFLKAV